MSDKKKWVKLGTLMSNKKTDSEGKPTGSYIQFGTAKSKYQPVNVKITVTDLNGNVVAEVTNPNLHVQDPRKRPGITDEQKAQIPAYILREISLPPAKE